MARTEVKLYPNSGVQDYKLTRKHEITTSESMNGERYMYYVRNSFSQDSYESCFKLYRFQIMKETDYFYFLINKQRVRKKSDGRLCSTPEEALRKAISRAETYLRILMDKARCVNDFLVSANSGNKDRNLKDIRGFEAFVKSLGPEEAIPPEAYRKLLAHDGFDMETPF